MMKWYRCYYGTWKEPHGVVFVRAGYNRDEVFEAAQKTANETGRVVTVSAEWATGRGMTSDFYKVEPKR